MESAVLEPTDVSRVIKPEPNVDPDTEDCELEEESSETELDVGGVIKKDPDMESMVLELTDMSRVIKLEPNVEPDTEDRELEEDSSETELNAGKMIKKELDIGPVVLQPTDMYYLMKPEPKLEPDVEEWKLCQEPTVELKRLLLCNDCNDSFTRRSALIKHITEVHSSNIHRI